MDLVLVVDEPCQRAVLLAILDEVLLRQVLVAPECRDFLLGRFLCIALTVNLCELMLERLPVAEILALGVLFEVLLHVCRRR